MKPKRRERVREALIKVIASPGARKDVERAKALPWSEYERQREDARKAWKRSEQG